MTSKLWAVDRDPSDHGEGRLKVEGDKTVFINKKAVVTHETKADPDNEGHTSEETKTKAESWSKTVFAYKKHAHRKDDERVCGAKTVVEGQSTVFIG